MAYLETHKAELQDELKTLVDEDKTQLCRTEPDAKLMKSGREGTVVGYNAQNAVDEEYQLIVHHDLTQAGSDNQQLKPIAQETMMYWRQTRNPRCRCRLLQRSADQRASVFWARCGSAIEPGGQQSGKRRVLPET